MKKTIALISLGVVLALTGCGGAAQEKESINVYNWGDYIDEDILVQFEEETGIHVNYDTFANNEMMYAKIKTGGSNYDMLIPSDYMIEKMRSEDMLEKIDLNNIPNFEHIHERFKNLPYDPDNEYSVPYMWGTLGIMYNTTMVDEPVDSWNILWDEKYSGQIYMYNSQRDSLAVALKKLGYSLNSVDSQELEKAKIELIKQKPLVQAYVGDNVKDKMIGGEGALAVVYSGDAMFCKGENEDLEYAIPKESSNAWYDSIVILKDSPNKANVEKFIDFLCRPDIAQKNTEYIGYSTVNEGALELINPELPSDETYWPTDDIFYTLEVFKDLGTNIKEYDIIWTEITVSN